MLKEIKTEETLHCFVTFLSLVTFQLGGMIALPPAGYAYVFRAVSTSVYLL